MNARCPHCHKPVELALVLPNHDASMEIYAKQRLRGETPARARAAADSVQREQTKPLKADQCKRCGDWKSAHRINAGETPAKYGECQRCECDGYR